MKKVMIKVLDKPKKIWGRESESVYKFHLIIYKFLIHVKVETEYYC